MAEAIHIDSEQALEAILKEQGLNAPRVTPEWIDSLIETVTYFEVSASHTICKITFFGGRFHVIGESSTVSPENFDKKIGEDVSYRNARNKIWPIAGAVLAHELFRGRLPLTAEQQALDSGVQQVISQLNQTLAWNKGMLELFTNSDEDILEAVQNPDELADLKEQGRLLQDLSNVLQRRLSRIGL